MASGSNRRKLMAEAVVVGSTSTSGATAESSQAQSFDAVTYYVNVTTATAGSITFVIQSSPDDGTTWASLSSAEMTGDTAAISSTGMKHISSNAPIGVRTRLQYTIATGPFAFTVYPCFQKAGTVF
jgi:hypothetical protein